MMKHRVAKSAVTAALVLALAGTSFFAGCSGGGPKGAASNAGGGGAELLSLEYGRLVDIYAYRRVEVGEADRRNTLNRTPFLVAANVVIDPSIQSQVLFNAVGGENTGADYRFLPFDVAVGHEELMILWDDRVAGEKERFQAALDSAQRSLVDVPASFRGQNAPIPVVPRNAALKLTFNAVLTVNEAFFLANPSALQLLEFRGDPSALPVTEAFRPIPVRVIPNGRVLIVDPSLIGAESTAATTAGMPPSRTQTVANIRLAMPTRAQISSQFNIKADPVASLNGPDSTGRTSLVRDFRSGNAADGQGGALKDLEAPMIVADIPMGIVGVQTAAAFTGDPDEIGWVVTLNKRAALVAVRGRIPFVDGGRGTDGLPGGPSSVPTQLPLRSGDILWQDVPLASGETVRVRAEVLLDEGVVNNIGGTPALGRTPAGDDGGSNTVARVRISSIDSGRDSTGNPVAFVASSLPLGQDCTVRVHYYQNVPYVGQGFAVDDSRRVEEFAAIEPVVPFLGPNGNPTRGPGRTSLVDLEMVDPVAAIGVRFSEPMDLSIADPLNNIVLSNQSFRSTPQGGVDQLLLEPKPAGLDVIGSRLVDHDGDGTLLRLAPPLGLYHEASKAEVYWLHVVGGDGAPRDLSGNTLDLFDRQLTAANSFSMQFSVNPMAPENLAATRVMRFEDFDEDGTPPGSEDFFGQFTLAEGRLGGAITQRSRQIADGQTIATITRYEKGECWDAVPEVGMPPPAPSSIAPTVIPGGVLYQCPSNVLSQLTPPPVFIPPPPPLTFGGILEPHNPRGSRLQMTYREDDFMLGYTDKDQLNLDMEQLHWARFNNEDVLFDVFDRLTIEAGHSDWRPDHLYCFDQTAPACNLDCMSQLSGLRNDFLSNVLDGTSLQPLVQDKVYTINPNAAFQTSTGTKFVPYAKFDRSYTWRDSRLVSWDRNLNRATGLGGSKQPDGVPPNQDRTAHVSSPWIQEPPSPFAQPSTQLLCDSTNPSRPVDPLATGFSGSVWTMSDADFRGERVRDHDPIAMPLLLDFKVYPDDPQNGIAKGTNKFHIGYVGPCWSALAPGGYYNFGSLVCGPPGVDYPTLRVHTSGGVTGQGIEQLVDIPSALSATGGWIFDAGLGDPNGRYQTKPHNVTGAYGDAHLHWAAADFVRKVSLVTYGFFDTQAPNQHLLDNSSITTSWPGLGNQRGTPDFAALATSRGIGFGVSDLVLVQDPPASSQPAGTSVAVEVRGAASFARSALDPQNPGELYIWDKVQQDQFDLRGNLLNPNYACEAYRYAMPNSPAGTGLPRVLATGLTPYAVEKELDSIRNGNGQLPRFLNLRITFENDVQSVPAQTPFLRSIVVAYRMAQQ